MSTCVMDFLTAIANMDLLMPVADTILTVSVS